MRRANDLAERVRVLEEVVTELAVVVKGTMAILAQVLDGRETTRERWDIRGAIEMVPRPGAGGRDPARDPVSASRRRRPKPHPPRCEICGGVFADNTPYDHDACEEGPGFLDPDELDRDLEPEDGGR